MVSQLDPGLPDCLPILGAALLSQAPDPALPPRPDSEPPGALTLPALLSRMLLASAVEYERETGLSLAVSANLLRVLGEDGIRRRDLPALTGISKEAVAWALGILVRAGMAALLSQGPDPAARRGKVARLTRLGLDAQRRYHERLGTLEADWRDRFGPDVIQAVRTALEPLAAVEPAPLLAAVEPYPDNWRARRPRPAILPFFPMVLHRGGYPDGS